MSDHHTCPPQSPIKMSSLLSLLCMKFKIQPKIKPPIKHQHHYPPRKSLSSSVVSPDLSFWWWTTSTKGTRWTRKTRASRVWQPKEEQAQHQRWRILRESRRRPFFSQASKFLAKSPVQILLSLLEERNWNLYLDSLRLSFWFSLIFKKEGTFTRLMAVLRLMGFSRFWPFDFTFDAWMIFFLNPPQLRGSPV